MNFLAKIKSKWSEQKFLCIGLDQPDFSLNKTIIDATSDLACAYKPNSAFYEAAGLNGRKALEQTIGYLKQNHPDIPIILDAKRADIALSSKQYAKDAFDNLGCDALTINPYLGKEALLPFLERSDKGIFVLVKTSNPGSPEFQDLIVGPNQKPLYQTVAKNVALSWNENDNCGVVVGATYPKELKTVREIVGDLPILVPGIGVQSKDLKGVLENGLNSKNQGLIINSSRVIAQSANPRLTALDLHRQITGILGSK